MFKFRLGRGVISATAGRYQSRFAERGNPASQNCPPGLRRVAACECFRDGRYPKLPVTADVFTAFRGAHFRLGIFSFPGASNATLWEADHQEIPISST